jgi:hypothetical protein
VLFFGFLLALLNSISSSAEMITLEDSELSAVQGAGIGIVLEQILMDAGQTDANRASITINDITNGAGQNVPITVKEFYLGATGSNKGATLNPVNIGRLSHPITVSLDKGEQISSLSEVWTLKNKVVKEVGVNKTVFYWDPTGTQQSIQTTPSGMAVLGLTFPERLPVGQAGGQACISGFSAAGGNCSSRATEKVDMGVRFDFQVAAGRTDVINIDITELAMDGSYLRLWGDGTRAQLVGEARLNIFAKTLDVMSCDTATLTCDTAAEQAARSLYLTNAYSNVVLGYGKAQPLLLDVTSDGQFALELPNPVLDPSNPTAPVNTLSGVGKQRADDFYTNAPRTNIVVDNLNFGGARVTGTVPNAGTISGTGVYTPGPVPVTGGYNFGRNEISGMSFNYMKATSHDL